MFLFIIIYKFGPVLEGCLLGLPLLLQNFYLIFKFHLLQGEISNLIGHLIDLLVFFVQLNAQLDVVVPLLLEKLAYFVVFGRCAQGDRIEGLFIVSAGLLQLFSLTLIVVNDSISLL